MTLPKDGYLKLPLRFKGGQLAKCTIEESLRLWLQQCLNVPLQSESRPVWMPADPQLGCRVPHYDFEAVVRTMHGDVHRLVDAVRKTIRACEPRVRKEDVEVRDVPKDDPARNWRGRWLTGPMKRIWIRLERTDGRVTEIAYEIDFSGPGPVFEEPADDA